MTISALSLAEASIVAEARQGPDAGASLANLPLLYRGDAFPQTDLRAV